jgi:glycosyltransferase involved in cell wall biosynthesis
MAQIKLSFVVLAFNEKEFIKMLELIDDLTADRHIPYDILVADDGSRDDTFAKVRRYT